MKIPLLLLLLLAALNISAQRPAKPNFVLILADDLGWQDLKCYDTEAPFSVFQTPYIDSLATEGILFRQAYSPAPTCAPSRSGIMSGKFPARVDNTHVVGGECPKPYNLANRMMDPYYNARLELEEITIAEELKPNGYFSGHIGKWHMAVSHNSFPQPLDQGFDWTSNSRGVTVGMSDRLTGFGTTDPSDPYQLDANGFAFDQTTEDALTFLDEAVTREDPFFCYYASWLVHTPIQMRTESLLQKYAGLMGYSYPLDGSEFFAEGQNNPFYAAMVETFDYNVHRILTYLKDTDDPRWPGHKLIENTYVFITSDNGGYEGTASNEWITDNFPLDEGKIHAEEGGTRVPFIVLGADVPASLTSEVMVNGLDLYPTMLALAGMPIPERLDGCDLSSLLLSDPQDPDLVTHPGGAVRDTMFWHFPHGNALQSTIRKDGWKLFKNWDHVNNPALEPYRLYELYDPSGLREDIEEANDLYATQPTMVSQLASELESWLTSVDASVPHYNPKTSQTLLNKDQVPAVIDSGSSNGVAWVTFETDKAAVERVELIYTPNGDNSVNEEWFDLNVPFVPASGYAEITIPDGTTHFVFNLIDENNFLVSSVDVGAVNINTGKDSTIVPRYVREPAAEALVTDAGIAFPTNDVVLSNEVAELAGVPIRDDTSGSPVQAGGQTFTITSSTLLTSLTLKSASTTSFGTGDYKLTLWIGKYSGGTPSPASEDTKVFEWIDLSESSFTNLNYYTIDFTDVLLEPGQYAFQLAWQSNASDHLINFWRANGGGTYTGGARLYASSTTETIYPPFSAGAEQPDNDLVFALHGSVVSPYDTWAASFGLDLIPGDPDLNTVGATSLPVERDATGFYKYSDSAWTITHGILANSSLINSRVGEGAIGRVFDLSALPDGPENQIQLSFDYSTGDSSEKLYVHLWGYVDVSSVSTTKTINTGGSNGNAWESALGAMTAYNLGQADGIFTDTPGKASDAAVLIEGASGSANFSQIFDLSTFTTAPDTVSGYDYIVLGFAREIGTASTPAVTISNIVISAIGGETLFEFMEEVPADAPEANPDRDQLINLMEYAFGGDPTQGGDFSVLPFLVTNAGGVPGALEYVYRRRPDAATRGLAYTVQRSTTLQPGSWDTAGVTETGTDPVDADFESVTTEVQGGDSVFINLNVDLAE
ncbi:sulfatase [Puniceicoccales bacterium CK1056]|uniref:Sulfatase n=1 Tax=Oceanipulchritudo coccoides TaxID=2706888 RepID=A0A6B2M1R0_9BACT|nr:sulfatase [Oceanipulchritudo coccoides]NDV62074.1 sulfatase [Oceanipulchritudo coccoides]